jgi:predicted metal-binding protein
VVCEWCRKAGKKMQEKRELEGTALLRTMHSHCVNIKRNESAGFLVRGTWCDCQHKIRNSIAGQEPK